MVIVAIPFVKLQADRRFEIKYAPGIVIRTRQDGECQYIQTQYGADPFHGVKVIEFKVQCNCIEVKQGEVSRGKKQLMAFPSAISLIIA